MARNLLIILPVIVFVAITWSICFLMDNKLVLFFFEKGHYVFSTGTGLRGLVIIKANVGKDTSCKIILTNTYTKSIKHHWVLNDKCKRIFIVYIPSQYLEVEVDGNSANDFVVECLSFNKK